MIDIASYSETQVLTMEQILAVIGRIYAEEQAQWRAPAAARSHDIRLEPIAIHEPSSP